jgi:hypothetical protein
MRAARNCGTSPSWPCAARRNRSMASTEERCCNLRTAVTSSGNISTCSASGITCRPPGLSRPRSPHIHPQWSGPHHHAACPGRTGKAVSRPRKQKWRSGFEAPLAHDAATLPLRKSATTAIARQVQWNSAGATLQISHASKIPKKQTLQTLCEIRGRKIFGAIICPGVHVRAFLAGCGDAWHLVSWV